MEGVDLVVNLHVCKKVSQDSNLYTLDLWTNKINKTKKTLTSTNKPSSNINPRLFNNHTHLTLQPKKLQHPKVNNFSNSPNPP